MRTSLSCTLCSRRSLKTYGSDSGVTTVDDVKSAFAVLSEISIES